MDIDRLRADTPACKEILHFNNAGASLVPDIVNETLVAHLELESRVGGYEAANQVADTGAAVYDSIAALLNCGAGDIALCESATHAWHLAFHSLDFSEGDRILTSASEYASNYVSLLQARRRYGIEIDVVPSLENGQIDIKELDRRLDSRTRLIALTHAPSSCGLIQPVEAVGRLAQAAGVPFLLDACQSVGQLHLDVEKIGCDMLSATGRKFLRAPRGTGFLYIRPDCLERLEPPFIDLHSAPWVTTDRYQLRDDARRFETFESSYACRLGLGSAVDYALQLGLDSISKRVNTLADMLRKELSKLSGLHLADYGLGTGGIVAFHMIGLESAAIVDRLRERRINTSLATARFTRLDFESRQLPDLVRASVHYYNKEEEVHRFCEVMRTLIATGRR